MKERASIVPVKVPSAGETAARTSSSSLRRESASSSPENHERTERQPATVATAAPTTNPRRVSTKGMKHVVSRFGAAANEDHPGEWSLGARAVREAPGPGVARYGSLAGQRKAPDSPRHGGP